MSLSPHRGCGAYSRATLINFFVPDAALIRVNTVLRRERQLRVKSDVGLAKGHWNQTDQLPVRGRRTLGVPPADFPRFFLSAFSFSSSSIISRSINVISVLQRR